MSEGVCRLCQRTAEIVESHIISSFIFKWLKDTSATGYLRFGVNPNKRQQDGFKRYMLCRACEERFGIWESEFSRSVFKSLVAGQGFEPFTYGPWMAKFAASISWRVLNELVLSDPLAYLSEEEKKKLTEAELKWRQFLLGHRCYISPFDNHFVPLGYIESATDTDMPPNFNRYTARAVAIDIVSSENHTFVFTKLPFMLIVGILMTSRPGEWKGTRLHPDGGTFGVGKVIGLPGVIASYMNSKAVRMSEINDSISQRQKDVIAKFVRENPDKIANSKSFEAMSWDVNFFGSDAFEKEEMPDTGDFTKDGH